MTSKCDVLIVGAGPAGLMMAMWMSRLGISTRIVDKRGTKVFQGQADGLSSRTLEVFDSFGMVSRVLEHSDVLAIFSSWAPGKDGTIERMMTAPMAYPKSRYTTHLLNQGHIERHLMDSVTENSDIRVERGLLPTKLTIDESEIGNADAYPITVDLQHLTEQEATPFQSKAHAKNGEVADGLYRSNLVVDRTADLVRNVADRNDTRETIRAKYVIGCDGAHSWIRQQVGFQMEGENTDMIWGAIDIIPITNFPDIRKGGTVQSKYGSMLIIPRENKLSRLYVQMKEVKPGEGARSNHSQISLGEIFKEAQRILEPYTLDYSYCDWWTAYQIGQRVSTGFQDKHNRVLLAGDAVHTHSPKGGQGMNTSMADTFNLGWKLGGVLKGWFPPSILETYTSERRKVAEDLIAMDHRLSGAMSGALPDEDVQALYMKNLDFLAGYAVNYQPSMLISNPSKHPSAHTTAAANIVLGTPIPSGPLQNYASGVPTELHSRLRSDGRWRVLIFPGTLESPTAFARLHTLGERLAPILARYTVQRTGFHVSTATRAAVQGSRPSSLVDVVTVLRAPAGDRDITDFPRALVPCDDVEGYDYDSVLVDAPLDGFERTYWVGCVAAGAGKLYERFGIAVGEGAEEGVEGRATGALIVCRPDQYVSLVVGMDDVDIVEEFFASVLVDQTGVKTHVNGNGAAAVATSAAAKLIEEVPKLANAAVGAVRGEPVAA